MEEGRCKTFVATGHVFGGSIGVVLLEHGRGDWAAYASSDTSVNAEMILKIVSDRWIIEEHFHDRQRDLGRRSAASSQPVFEHRLHDSRSSYNDSPKVQSMNKAILSLSRRRFLAQTGATLMAASHANDAFAKNSQEQPLRVIAYNVYECTGWPKDRPLGKRATDLQQMPERFANELALYAPDIINFSESPSEKIVNQIAERLGMNVVRFPSSGKWPGSLLSRFEIVEPQNVPVVGGKRSPDLFTRHWGRAIVKLPGGDDLIVHSAHLHPSDQEVRVREIDAMSASMKANLEADRSMLLMGDLNHEPMPPEYSAWREAGWIDTFTKAGEGTGLSIKSDTPTRRIDYVMAAGPIAHQVVESRPLFEGAFRVNNDDTNSFALSDHLPQLAVFERDK